MVKINTCYNLQMVLVDGHPHGNRNVYSHWLGPELGQGPGPGQVLCSTFHTAQGSGPESGLENHILSICIGKSQ